MGKITYIITITENIHNTEQCIKSIEEQNIKEKQVILISNVFNESQIKDSLNTENKEIQYTYIYDSNLKTLGELRNRALDEVRGDFVCFTNNNDFYEKNEMEKIFLQMLDKNVNVAIGRVFHFNERDISYAFEKANKTLICKNILNPKNHIDVFESTNIYNKIFNVEFIKKNNIKFAETKYYDYIPFVMDSLSLTNKVLINPKAHYVKRIKLGLDKINNPDLEEKIDFKQLDNFIEILEETLASKRTEFQKNIIINEYIKFLLDRGLKYINITNDKKYILNKIYKSIKNIKLEDFCLEEKDKCILELIQNMKFDEYFRYLEENRISVLKNTKPLVYLKQVIFKNMYNIFSKLPIRKNSVLFLAHSPGMDGNFKYIDAAIKEYNSHAKINRKFRTSFASTKCSLMGKAMIPLRLATAEFVILSESIPFFQHIDVRKGTSVIQSWHAAGAFKKFGYSTNYLKGGPNPFKNRKMNIHKGYDYATVSAQEVAKHYAEGFNMDINKIIPVGVPRTDFFFDKDKVNSTRNKIYELYPDLKDKKVILYAPTFRGVGKKRKSFKMKFDFNRIAEEISNEYVIVLKLHPSIESSDIKIKESLKHKVINASSYKDANDILTVTDLLITDYSSIIFDYSLLSKPMIFFAYDLEEYLFDRDFYYKYEEFVPGPIVRTNKEIIKLIKQNKFDLNKIDEFCNKFFIARDGNSSKRFVENVLLKIKNKEI